MVRDALGRVRRCGYGGDSEIVAVYREFQTVTVFDLPVRFTRTNSTSPMPTNCCCTWAASPMGRATRS